MKQFLFIFATCLSLFGCAKADFDYIGASSSKADYYYSPNFEHFLSTKSESSKDYHIAMKEAADILIYYLKLDGTNYVLDISEEEAKALGIPRKIFYAHLGQVNKVNQEINDYISQGKNIRLSNPQSTLKRYNNPKTHTSLEKSYTTYRQASRSDDPLSSYSGAGITSEEYQWASENFQIYFTPSRITGQCRVIDDYELVALHLVSISISSNKQTWSSAEERISGTRACEAVPFEIYIPETFNVEGCGIIKGVVSYKASHPNGGKCKWTLIERKKKED